MQISLNWIYFPIPVPIAFENASFAANFLAIMFAVSFLIFFHLYEEFLTKIFLLFFIIFSILLILTISLPRPRIDILTYQSLEFFNYFGKPSNKLSPIIKCPILYSLIFFILFKYLVET